MDFSSIALKNLFLVVDTNLGVVGNLVVLIILVVPPLVCSIDTINMLTLLFQGVHPIVVSLKSLLEGQVCIKKHCTGIFVD